jgi:hypothetical protein
VFYAERERLNKVVISLSCDAQTMIDFVTCDPQTMASDDAVLSYDANGIVMVDAHTMTKNTCLVEFKCMMTTLVALRSTLKVLAPSCY